MLSAIQRTRLGEYAAEVVFLFSKLGDSLLEPTMRLFIYDAVCLNHFPSRDLCAGLHRHPAEELVVQNSASRYMMYYKVLTNFPAMLMVLGCGAWSDQAGRKLPVMLTAFGTTLAVLAYLLTDRVHGWVPYLPLVLAGAAIRGAFGRSAVVTMATHSYVSDHSAAEHRTARLSGLLATSHLGYLLGSVTSGVCLERFGFTVVFLMVIVIQTVVVLIAFVCMRDVRKDLEGERLDAVARANIGKKENDTTRKGKVNNRLLIVSSLSSPVSEQDTKLLITDDVFESSNTIDALESAANRCAKRQESGSLDNDLMLAPTSKRGGSISVVVDEPSEKTGLLAANHPEDSAAPRGCCRKLFDSFSVCARPVPGATSCTLFLLFFIIYLQQANKSGEADLLLLFSKRSPLNLGKADYGYLLAAIYASLGFFAFLVPRLLCWAKITVKDTTLALFGLSFKMANLIIVSFSTSKWMLFVACVVCGPQSLTISASKSMISKLCREVDLGKAFSIISSGETLASLVGTIVYTNIYSVTLSVYPGMAFLIEAGSYAAVFLLFLYLVVGCRRATETVSSEVQSVYGPIVACPGHKRRVSQYCSP